jgi:hypothetical protein
MYFLLRILDVWDPGRMYAKVIGQNLFTTPRTVRLKIILQPRNDCFATAMHRPARAAARARLPRTTTHHTPPAALRWHQRTAALRVLLALRVSAPTVLLFGRIVKNSPR